MKTRDEVIAGLRCCVKNEDAPCEDNCPYNGESSCVRKVMADALELLEGAVAKYED